MLCLFFVSCYISRVIDFFLSFFLQMILVKVPYPGWAIAVGVLVTLFPIMFTPIFACYYFVRKVRRKDEVTVPIGV